MKGPRRRQARRELFTKRRRIKQAQNERLQELDDVEEARYEFWSTLGNATFILGLVMLSAYIIGFTQRLPFSERIPLGVGACGFLVAFGGVLVVGSDFLQVFRYVRKTKTATIGGLLLCGIGATACLVLMFADPVAG